MGRTGIDTLDHARTIVNACLERDYRAMHRIDTTTQLTTMRRDFEQYRDRFQSAASAESPAAAIDDDPSFVQMSTLRCVVFLALFVVSCVAVWSWYARLQ